MRYINEIKGFENSINDNVITTCGRVYKLNIPHLPELGYKLRKLQVNNVGYEYIGITVGGVKKTISVHRLVAYAFLNLEVNSELHVNHLDEDKTNNAVPNLKVVTLIENLNYGTRKVRSKSNTIDFSKRKYAMEEFIKSKNLEAEFEEYFYKNYDKLPKTKGERRKIV